MSPTRDLEVFARSAAVARASLDDDPQRPRYHFVPPANWMNDPNGLIQWRGRYHLFYQHNPYGPLWGDMHWGHAMSDDLVHWQDLPIALAPTPGSYDQDGIFSGCVVDDNGRPTLLYTGVRGPHELVCLATADASDDQLVVWRKWPGNPVIPELPPDLSLVAYRDPSVCRAADGSWLLVHGAGIVGRGGAVLLYRSPDLRTWTYVGPLLVGDATRHSAVPVGSLWECPHLFALRDKHVLLVSVWDNGEPRQAVYMVGNFDGTRFAPEHQGVLDAGALYAPQTMCETSGRRLLWGWLRERRSPQAMASSGWNGAMSLPWELTLREDGTLAAQPVPEMVALRGEHARYENVTLGSDADRQLNAGGGACLEAIAIFDCGSAWRLGLSVRRSPRGEEETRIVYEPTTGGLTIDRDRSSLGQSIDAEACSAVVACGNDHLLRLHIFLDRSVIEVFANQHVALTERIYPTRPDSLGLSVFAEGGDATLQSLDAWVMRSIWTEGPLYQHEHLNGG